MAGCSPTPVLIVVFVVLVSIFNRPTCKSCPFHSCNLDCLPFYFFLPRFFAQISNPSDIPPGCIQYPAFSIQSQGQFGACRFPKHHVYQDGAVTSFCTLIVQVRTVAEHYTHTPFRVFEV